ncbi:MAG TPA: flagellar FliJ family protein [Gaiellaceae bacterium]|jgi:flagellar export protein FliJ
MRPFRFQLEAVRALREHAETSSRVELAGELSTALTRRQELAEATVMLEDARTNAPFVDGSTVSAWDILATDAYLQRRETARAAAAEAMLIQERRIEIHRNLLVEASRKRQALEMLKARRAEAHRAEAERIEIAHLNDVALLLHDRRLRDAQ